MRRTYPTAGLDWFEQLHPLCRQYTIFPSGVCPDAMPGIVPVRRHDRTLRVATDGSRLSPPECAPPGIVPAGRFAYASFIRPQRLYAFAETHTERLRFGNRKQH